MLSRDLKGECSSFYFV